MARSVLACLMLCRKGDKPWPAALPFGVPWSMRGWGTAGATLWRAWRFGFDRGDCGPVAWCLGAFCLGCRACGAGVFLSRVARPSGGRACDGLAVLWTNRGADRRDGPLSLGRAAPDV